MAAEGSSCASSPNLVQDDHTPLWAYVKRVEKMGEGGGNWRFECNFCHGEFKGSYYRVKAHLLKMSGHGIRVCSKVSSQNLFEMKRVVEESEKESSRCNAQTSTIAKVVKPNDSNNRRARNFYVT